MAFGDPFAANVDRKMTKGELIQSIRADISGELDAIYGYDAHVQATDEPDPAPRSPQCGRECRQGVRRAPRPGV